MEGHDSGTRRVLQMMEIEACIGHDLIDKFCEDLSAREPNNGLEALQCAVDVLLSQFPLFALQGREVEPGDFSVLVHVNKPTNLKWHTSVDFQNQLGLSDAALEKMQAADIAEIYSDWNDRVSVGSPKSVTWVTHSDAIDIDVVLGPELYDRLGLEWSTRDQCCLVFTYRRAEAGKLCVPRVFDGMHFYKFALVSACDAPSGVTMPNSGSETPGLPEAVHLGSAVQLDQFKVKSL